MIIRFKEVIKTTI